MDGSEWEVDEDDDEVEEAEDDDEDEVDLDDDEEDDEVFGHFHLIVPSFVSLTMLVGFCPPSHDGTSQVSLLPM